MFGLGHYGFPSETRAADAAARFVESLKSCSATAWRVQPIAQAGALLASSPTGVAWIQQGYREVWVIQAPTTDGPPPANVQVAIAEWLTDYIAEQNTDWTLARPQFGKSALSAAVPCCIWLKT